MVRKNITVVLLGIIFHLIAINKGFTQVSGTMMPSLGSPVPLAPNAAAIAKYTETPVSFYTGIPNISIPIYEIKSGTLSMPISLSYHAGGVKVEEIASWVGMGWSLNAGGMISRQARGIADEDDGGYLSDYSEVNQVMNGTMPAEDLYDFFSDVENSIKDSQQDIFIYNFGSESGKFFLDSTGAATSIPVSRNKFELGTFEGNSKCWKVTDTRGVQYYFTNKETTLTNPVLSGSLPPSPPPSMTTSWYLTKVKNAQGTDSITLTYTHTTITTKTNIAQTKYLLAQNGADCAQQAPDSKYSVNTVSGWRLSEIDFNNGKVVFNADPQPRCDLSSDRALSSIEIFNLTGTLHTKFQFHQSYLSTTGGDCDNSNEENNRLFLDSVSYIDASGGNLQRYAMTYNKTILLPSRRSYNQDHWGYFNNASNQLNFVPTVDADYGGTIIHLAGANREPNSSYNQAGILTSLKYPTGGRTEYEYETNTAFNTNTTTTITAGHRQIFIDNTILNGRLYLDTTFVESDYGPNLELGVDAKFSINNGGGSCNTSAHIGCPIGNITGPANAGPIYKNVASFFLPIGTYHLVVDLRTVTDQSIIDNFFFSISWPYSSVNVDTLRNNTNVGGLRIKRILGYASDNTKTNVHKYSYFLPDSIAHSSGFLVSFPEYQGGITKYVNASACPFLTFSSSSNYPLVTTNGSYTGYKYVQELLGENGEFGMNLYKFKAPDSVKDVVSTKIPYPPGISYDWARGLLEHSWSYRWVGGEIGYQLVTETSKQYQFNQTSSISGLQITRTAFYTGQFDVLGANSYTIVPFQTVSGWIPLVRQTDISCDQNDPLKFSTKITDIVNSDIHYQPIQISTDNSNGESTVAKMSYPLDYNGLTGSDALTRGILDLKNSNIISPIIEKYTQRLAPGGSLIGTVSAVLHSYKPTSMLPDTVWQTEFTQPSTSFSPLSTAGGQIIKDGAYRPQLHYSKYDANLNISQQEKIGDLPQAYIWDYKRSYPICKVDNADSNSIAYTSFEAEQTGTWSVGTGSIDATSGLTGRSSYLLSGTISRSGLNSSTTYIVSYWSQNSSPFSITGTQSGYPQKGKSVTYNNNTWTLYIHKVTGQSTISVSGTGHIDELRLYPADAQMTTYTYDPLVGMTSQTDPASRATYYEYDELARLKRIRDQDFNIVKTYDYQYALQGSCGPNCYPVTMQTFAGNNTPGYPVGVFNVHSKLLGNADNAAQYVSLWNSDTANAAIGTLATGADNLHFYLTLNAGRILPSGAIGCRYYQYDLAWNHLDGVRSENGVYVDFGDGIGTLLPGRTIPAQPIPSNSSVSADFKPNSYFYLIHDYPSTSNKTLTFYHNDTEEHNPGLDNFNNPALSSSKLQNFRGNMPQNCQTMWFSSYQDSSANTFSNILNWNTQTGFKFFGLHSGDGGGDDSHPVIHTNFEQDFMKNHRGLQSINTANPSYIWMGYWDPAFKLSRLKTDWNTYFTQLGDLEICEAHWNHEDLSALKHLTFFMLTADNTLHSNQSTGNVAIPIDSTVIDNVLIQIAAGSGQYNTGGLILILPAYGNRTSRSDDAVAFLKSRGWSIYFDFVPE